VADHAVLADYRWVTGVGVQHAAVLAAGNSLTLAFSLGLLRGVPRAFGGGPNVSSIIVYPSERGRGP
jgi:hypothetical protein